MSLEIGSQKRNTKGFSLIELIIVIGLMAAISTVCITNWDMIARGFDSAKPVDITLTQLVHEARYLASTTHDRIWLCYEEKEGRFYLRNTKGEDLLPQKELSSDKNKWPQVRFFPLSNEYIFDTKPKPISTEADDIVFDPDGSSMPVIAEIRVGANTKRYYIDAFASELIAMDKWDEK